MIRVLASFAALICGLMLSMAPSWADIQIGSYNGICHFHCCDQNNNCTTNQFYTGSGQGAFHSACNWASVCARQGEIGWSWSNVPRSQANSSVTYQRGCWTGWQGASFNSFYVKACARAMRH